MTQHTEGLVQDCGCIVIGGVRTLIQYCPLHAAAPALLDALEECLEAFHTLNTGGYSRESRCFNPGLYDDCPCTAHKARAAMRLARGEPNRA